MSVVVDVVDHTGLVCDPVAVRRLVELVLEAERVDGEVAVAFVEEAAMVELNKRYRGLDAPTDVLSFDYSADTGWPSEPGDGLRGEVVVCPSVVIQYAREEGRDAKEQLAWTLIHGALHLAGHDHETDRGEMREREEQLRGHLEGVVTSLSLGKGH